MDVPGGNRLDVLPVLSVIADAWQKHKAKKIFDSPEYRQHLGMLTGTQQQTGTGESQPNPGEMSPYLQKAALNPHVNNAINEAIKARLSALGGDLTQTQTAGMKQQQGFAQGDVKALGGMTPAAAEAKSRGTLVGETVASGEHQRLMQNLTSGDLSNAGLGSSPEAATALNQQEQNRNQSRMMDITKQHGESSNMVEFLKALGGNMGLMDITKQGSNFGDLMQMGAGSPGPLGEMMKALMNVQKGREADKAKRFKELTSGGGTEKPGSVPPGNVANPYEQQGVINAWKRMYGATAEYPADVSTPLLGGYDGLIAKYRGSQAPKLENNIQLNDQITKTMAEINKHIGSLKTLDKTSSSGYAKFNQTASKVLTLAKPLIEVSDRLEQMGSQKSPQLIQLIERLTELGINPRAAASEAGAAPIKK